MSKKAFTLIEMLVTITIISILAGFVVVKINDSNNLAKDTQRKADINLLANSVVSYSADHYSGKPITDENGCTIGGGADQCSTEIEEALKAYLPTLPKEPNSNAYYVYWSNGNECTVTANLSSSNPEDAYVYNCATDVASAGDSVNGACGSAANTSATGYASSISDWPTSNFCNAGTLYTSPAWPAQGASSSWTCVGEYLGSNTTCTAYRALDGVCGTAKKTYADAATSYGSDTICAIGASSPASPAWPAKGASTTWSCLGVNNGATVSCTAQHTANGVCGTRNKTYADAATSYGSDTICTYGTASPASPAWPAKGASTAWACNGIFGGTNASCTANHSLNGTCGTAVRTFADAETSYGSYTICAAGTASPASPAFPAKGASTTWACNGALSGTNASCTANHSLNGACGTANGVTYAYSTTTYGTDTICAAGTASPASPAFPAAGGSTSWTCVGALSGTTASCSASRYAAAPIAGVCGSASQNCASIAATVAPTANLCSKGTASAISGTGPWTWTCSGQYGGATSPTCVVYKADFTLYQNRHSAAQCTCMGGTVASWAGSPFCKMPMNSCTGNWLWYGDLSEHAGSWCSGGTGFPGCYTSSCSTAARAWGTGPGTTCSYVGAAAASGCMICDGGTACCDCVYATCYSQPTWKGCY